MPITVTATEGVFQETARAHILPRLSRALLERHGLSGNAFMTPAVVGSLNIVPAGQLFAGGRAEKAVFVELKVPSSTFATAEIRQGYLDDVHRILDELTGGDYPKDKVFFNIVYAVDGSWGIGARAYTNAEIGEAIAAAAPVHA